MAKQQRIDHFNLWPKIQDFQAEVLFKARTAKFQTHQLFFPYQISATNDRHVHIVLSYLLDAVDSLPNRPDHSFDWTWRAFEYLAGTSSGGVGNITELIRSTISPEINTYFGANQQVEGAFFDLIAKIPFQTCEYWLTRIVESAPYTFATGNHKNLSSYAKRLLFASGQPPVANPSIEAVLNYLSTNYGRASDRRDGASLLRRIVRGENVLLGAVNVRLTRSECFFFLLSGLAYAFRNDRAHAKHIAPFRSSFATVRTYAHCWFMFLMMYQITFVLFHTSQSIPTFLGNPAQNFLDNNKAYADLFGDYVNS